MDYLLKYPILKKLDIQTSLDGIDIQSKTLNRDKLFDFLKKLDFNVTKDVGSKDVGSKDVESKDVGSKDVGSKDVGSKDVGSKDVGSKDVGSKDVGSKDETRIRVNDIYDKNVFYEIFDKNIKRKEFRPKYYTETELLNLIDIPKIKAVDGFIAESIYLNIKKKIVNILLKEKISSLIIPFFVDEIFRVFQNSIIHPGTMVGVTTGEALGGPATQMALNSFHASGSSKNVSGGFEAIQELLYVRKQRKHESMTIHFKEQVSMDDFIYNKKVFQGKTFKQRYPQIQLHKCLTKKTKWSSTGYLLDRIKNIVQTIDQPFIQLYNRINHNTNLSVYQGDDITIDTWMVRLFFDKQILYEYQISLSDIKRVLDTQCTFVRTIVSPMNLCYIDILPNVEKIVQTIQSKTVKNRLIMIIVF
jgi:hypothetical protein